MADIKISRNELDDPAIDEVVNLQKSLARTGGEFVENIRTPLYLNPIFYYSVAAFAAGLAAWAIEEPFYNEAKEGRAMAIPFFSDYLLFGPVAGLIGLSVGLAYGFANRNFLKALYCSAIGIGVGLGVTILSTFVAEMLYGITSMLAVSMAGPSAFESDHMLRLRGGPFFIQMCGRGMAWAIISIGAGLSLGVSLKSKKLLLNGLAGGLIGGMLGGLLFDPVHRFILDWGPSAGLSRAVGIGAVGLLVGFFIGLFENMSKDSWFLMLRGPLSGKQFIVFKSPMMIGSAPKCDIYLFKDPAIEPRHASVTRSGAKSVIQDEGTPSGTFVNGKKVDRYVLQPDDIVSIGETVLKYQERAKS